MRHLRSLLFFCAVIGAFAQSPSATFHGNGAPSLPCGPAQLYQQDNAAPAALWFCQSPSNTASTSNWALLGTSGSTNATSIQGNAVKTGTPTSGQVYAWNSTNSDFELSSSSGGGASLSATNQTWTGAGSLTMANGSGILTMGVNNPLGTAATPGGSSTGGSKFQLNFDPQTYVGSDATIIDTQMSLGYNRCMNAASCVGTEPAWFMGWEDDYVVPGQSKTSNLFNEWYMQFQPTPNGATRPIFVQVHRDAGCITANNCEINDFELNSSFTSGIGFHSWDNNAIEWAAIKGTGLNLFGYAAQTTDTFVNVAGQNGTFGSLFLNNGTVSNGFTIQSVSDNLNIWQMNFPSCSNWINFNSLKTSLGCSGAFNGNATLSVQAGSGTNVAMSIGLNSSNTADLLRFYSNASALLGQVSSAGLLTLPNITTGGTMTAATLKGTGLTSGNCLQASTGGVVIDTGSACGSGGGAVSSVVNSDGTITISPTTGSVVASLNLSAENTWTVNGAASLAGVKYAGTMFTGGSGTTTFPYMLIDNGGTAVTSWSTGGTVIGINAASGFTGPLIDMHVNGASTSAHQFRADGSWIAAAAEINLHGNASFGGAGDNAGTGSAVFASGAITSSGSYHFNSKSWLSSPADGKFELTNNATTGFNTMYFGPASSGFPALNVNTTELQVVAGDGSDTASLKASNIRPSAAVTNETGSSGSCNISMPFQGATDKKVVAVCSGLNGTTASYTYPLAFSNTPGATVSLTGGTTGLTVATASTTALTITGTGSSAGVIVLEGY